MPNKRRLSNEESESSLIKITKKRSKGHSKKKNSTKKVKKTQLNDVPEIDDNSSDISTQVSQDSNNTEIQQQEEKAKDDNFKKILNSLPNVYPLKIHKEDIKLNIEPIEDKVLTATREITFKGTYKIIPITCICIITTTGDKTVYEQRNQHEWNMSEKLRLCRNMATYLGQFKADPIELNIDFLNNTIAEKKLPAWFFIKPYYELGTLRHYLRERKKKRLELEPLYVLQMAVTLFSILTDAHSQNIGLVDITMDSLYVNTDGGLYFGGFKSCVSLDPESLSKQKDSFDTSSIKCPEIKIIKAGNYMKECDVFLACHVLLQVIQKNFGQYTRLYKQILKAEKIEILREYLNPKFKFLIPVLEQGLCYRYQDRPPASELLVAFESMRYNAIKTAAETEL